MVAFVRAIRMENLEISLRIMFVVLAGENCSTRKRGRPAVVVTEEVIQRRRISRQRVNAARPKSE